MNSKKTLASLLVLAFTFSFLLTGCGHEKPMDGDTEEGKAEMEMMDDKAEGGEEAAK